MVNLFFLLLQGKSYLQSLKDDIKPKPASPLATPVDLIDFGGSNPAPGIPLATSYGEVNSAQSNPYFGGQPEATNFAEQSFASSQPAITTGYGPPPTNFAVDPGAFVVPSPLTGYGEYGVMQSDNSHGVTETQAPSNPYSNTNSYAHASAPNPTTTTHQYTLPQVYPLSEMHTKQDRIHMVAPHLLPTPIESLLHLPKILTLYQRNLKSHQPR